MPNKTIVSCRNCLDRYPGCHQYCKTYKKERELSMKGRKLRSETVKMSITTLLRG